MIALTATAEDQHYTGANLAPPFAIDSISGGFD